MKMDKRLIWLAFASLGGMLIGCGGTTTQTKLQYMPDMADTPTVKAQQDYLDPPDNSVPRTGTFYPDMDSPLWDDFSNPYQATPKNIAAGKVAYQMFCQHCHGVDGNGQSTLSDAYPVKAIPALNRAELKSQNDLFFFKRIMDGGAMMPALSHIVDVKERWQITLYLRTLQK